MPRVAGISLRRADDIGWAAGQHKRVKSLLIAIALGACLAVVVVMITAHFLAGQ
jgi:hypothetical protein